MYDPNARENDVWRFGGGPHPPPSHPPAPLTMEGGRGTPNSATPNRECLLAMSTVGVALTTVQVRFRRG